MKHLREYINEKKYVIGAVVVIVIAFALGIRFLGRTMPESENAADEQQQQQQQDAQMARTDLGRLDPMSVVTKSMKTESVDGSVYEENLTLLSTTDPTEEAFQAATAAGGQPKTMTSAVKSSSSSGSPGYIDPVQQLVAIKNVDGYGIHMRRLQSEFSTRETNPLLEGRPFLFGADLETLQRGFLARGQELVGGPTGRPQGTVQVDSPRLPAIDPDESCLKLNISRFSDVLEELDESTDEPEEPSDEPALMAPLPDDLVGNNGA